MKDEILAKALSTDTEIVPRYDIVKPDGTKLAENAELVLKNAVTQQGTPYNKASVLTDETAAKIWGSVPPSDPTVSDALGSLPDLAGAVISLPISDGTEITAGDVVDVLNGYITRPTTFTKTSGEVLTTANAQSPLTNSYIHRIDAANYLVFYTTYYNNSYTTAVWYVKIVNGNLVVRGSYGGTISSAAGFDALSDNSAFTCATRPDGKVVCLYYDGSGVVLTPNDADSGASVSTFTSASVSPGLDSVGPIVKITNSEIYTAYCKCNYQTYSINIAKLTMSGNSIAWSGWVSTYTSPTITGIPSGNASNSSAKYTPMTDDRGILSFLMYMNSGRYLISVGVLISESGISVVGQPETLSAITQFPLCSDNDITLKHKTYKTTNTSAVIIYDGKEAQANNTFAVAQFLTQDATSGLVSMGSSVNTKDKATAAQILSSAFFGDILRIWVNIGTSSSPNNTEWVVSVGESTLTEQDFNTITGTNTYPASIISISDALHKAMSVPYVTNVGNSLTINLEIMQDVSTADQAVALESGGAGDIIRIAYSGNARIPGVTKGKEITSNGVNAKSYVDGIISIFQPTSSAARIVTGSYIGNGTSTTVELVLGMAAKYVAIIDASDSVDMLFSVVESGFGKSINSSSSSTSGVSGSNVTIKRTAIGATETSISFEGYSTYLNVNGRTYYYVAIG